MVVEGVDAWEALRRVAPQVVFTTHTPVPAGHDRFSPALVEEHLGPLRESLGVDRPVSWPRPREPVGRQRNFLHDGACAQVVPPRQRRLVAARPGLARCGALAPDRSEDRVPIGHITNGVHVPTWLAPQMRQVYDRHLGPNWAARASDASLWERIDAIDDGELWETHQTLKVQLIETVRRRTAHRAERRGEPAELVAPLRRALSFDALTIGFARRFATYKRATLMLRDIETFAALVNNATMPVQFVFAGKSHPHDGPGKALLREIAQLTRDPRFAGKLVFVEDYDINVGRHLVQGVDVWINNPRRPLEACGTSGQKIVLNGGLNLSILDGWWAEAYDGVNGFAIGMGETHTSIDVHDRRDGESLLEVLRDVVVPLYYNRDRDGLPRVDRARETRDPHARLALQRRPHGQGLPAQGLHRGGGRAQQRRQPRLTPSAT